MNLKRHDACAQVICACAWQRIDDLEARAEAAGGLLREAREALDEVAGQYCRNSCDLRSVGKHTAKCRTASAVLAKLAAREGT